MPLRSALAPGFIRLTYSGVINPHHQIIPIKFDGTPEQGTVPSVLSSGGTALNWRTAMNTYVASALAPQFNADTTFGLADIYSVDPDTGIATFIDTHNVNDNGENVAENLGLVQAVWMFKTSAGFPLKVYTMEAVYTPDVRDVGAVPADARQDLIDYVLSEDNIFYGRHDAYPIAFMSFTTKMNDVLRRRYGLSAV